MLQNAENSNFFTSPTSDLAAEHLADILCTAVRSNPKIVLGLATGGTMEAVYDKLIQAHHHGLSFAQMTSFNLDEYIGLSGAHPSSYAATMRRLFFDHIDVDQSRCHIPDGTAKSPEAEARHYEERIQKSGGIDLQVLGLGANGHIGFNEPGSKPDSVTRVVHLHPQTIQSNQRFFGACEQVPERAISMGIKSILSAKSIAVLATGPKKRDALNKALFGPVGPDCPASFVRDHANAVWITDQRF